MRLSHQPIIQCGNIQLIDKNIRHRSHSATRSFTDSTVNFMGRIGQSLRIASSSTNRRRQINKQEKNSQEQQQQEEEKTQQQQIPEGRRQSLAEQWFRTVRMRRRGIRGIAGTQSEELTRKNFIDQQKPRPHNLIVGQENQVITTTVEEDEETKILSQQQFHPLNMFNDNGNNVIRSSSPLSSSSAGFGCPAAVSRSCPPTPRPAINQRYLKEGYCQLTSIQTLTQHNRYMFLFDDVLLICKEKGEHNSCYKLKEKVSLEFIWLSSNNCTFSFLIGWPTARNYIAHFNTEREKIDWYEQLNAAIKRRLHPKCTTIGIFVQIEGRQQQIRREIRNGQRTDEIIEALIIELNLPIIDPHLGNYELCFCPGSRRNNGGGHHLTNFLPSNNNNLNNLNTFSTQLPTNILITENLTKTENSEENKNKETTNSSLSSSPAVLRRVQSHTSISSSPLVQTAYRSPFYNYQQQNNSAAIQPLHGVENVYAVLMEFVRSQLGISLSDSQLSHLDTCPLVNCKLLLRQTGPNNSPSHSSGHNKRAALNLVNQFRRVVLGRADSASSSGCNSPTTNPSQSFSIDPNNNGKKLKILNKKQRLFGRQLRGTMPPQPVLTMIDHLLLYGADAEGIFRKSPKQQTVRLLRQQLDLGQVPDFHQFNIHVTASLLKDYLRSIPGQLLLSGNYRLWADVATMCSPSSTNSSPKLSSSLSSSKIEKQNLLLHQDRVQRCKKLLALLPPAHTVLLRSVLRLLRKVAQNEEHTRMSVNALAVCIAPSLLEKLEQVESVRIIPQLVIFLIENASELFEGFLEDGPLLPNNTTIDNNQSNNNNKNISNSIPVQQTFSSPLHQSTDSGLADVNNFNNVKNAFMGTKRRFILTEQQIQNQQRQLEQIPLNNQNQRSVSPDSGKMSSEPPSEDDNDYWRKQQIKNNKKIIRNSWMLKAQSLDEGTKDSDISEPLGFGIVAPHIDDDLDDDDIDVDEENDDIELIDNLSSITINNHYYNNQQQLEDDIKTPIALSRENSDAKDCINGLLNYRISSNNNSNTNYLIKNANYNKINENNNEEIEANNNSSVLSSAASPNFAWRAKHLQQKQTYNQHKQQQRQTNAIRILQTTSNNNNNNLNQQQPLLLSPTESATPRKVSSTSSIGCNGSENSYNSNGINGTAALSRRALIATKSDALLGIHSSISQQSHNNEDERNQNNNNNPYYRPILLSSSTNSSPSSSPYKIVTKGTTTSQDSSPKIIKKVNLQRAIPLNGSSTLIMNSSSINSSNNKNSSSSSPPPSSMLRQRLPIHVETKRQNSTGTLLMMMNNNNNEKDDIISNFNKKEYYSPSSEFKSSPPPVSSTLQNLRRTSVSTNIETQIVPLNEKKSEEEKKQIILTRRPLAQRQQQPNQQKYIPPRRTAEELLLDKLEVNWSVPQIRKQFQQKDKANEPATAPVIDTLYVKLTGGQKQQQQRQINKKQQQPV